jgi:hypothetical protein
VTPAEKMRRVLNNDALAVPLLMQAAEARRGGMVVAPEVDFLGEDNVTRKNLYFFFLKKQTG